LNSNFCLFSDFTVPHENEATNDSISFEEVSVKEEAPDPDFENMFQMEEQLGSDHIGLDSAEHSAELTEGSK
jgi:hypothetical protein